MIAVDLVDDLSHTDDLTLEVHYGHGQDGVRPVPGLSVNLLIDKLVLETNKSVGKLSLSIRSLLQSLRSSGWFGEERFEFSFS